MLQVYAFTLGGLMLAQIAPGPNLLAVAGVALGQGRRNAIFTTLGIACALVLWVALAAFGLAALLALLPRAMIAMKLAGGGYLVFLGVKAMLAALRGGETHFRPLATPMTPAQAWTRGFLVNMSNPKSALVWAAIVSFLFGSGLDTAQVLAFAPLGFCSSLLIYGSYGVLFSSAPARRAYARFARLFETAFGLAFGALGSRLLWDGLREAGR